MTDVHLSHHYTVLSSQNRPLGRVDEPIFPLAATSLPEVSCTAALQSDQPMHHMPYGGEHVGFSG